VLHLHQQRSTKRSVPRLDRHGTSFDERKSLQAPCNGTQCLPWLRLRGYTDPDAPGRLLDHHLGCQMNKADPSGWPGILETMVMPLATDEFTAADLVSNNTCNDRATLEAEGPTATWAGRRAPRPPAPRPAQTPQIPISPLVVAGCVGPARRVRACCVRVPELDLVMGPQHAQPPGLLLEQVEAVSRCGHRPSHHILEEHSTTCPAAQRRLRLGECDLSAATSAVTYCRLCLACGVRSIANPRPRSARRSKSWSASATANPPLPWARTLMPTVVNLPGITAGVRAVSTRLTDLLPSQFSDARIERTVRTSHPRYFKPKR